MYTFLYIIIFPVYYYFSCILKKKIIKLGDLWRSLDEKSKKKKYGEEEDGKILVYYYNVK